MPSSLESIQLPIVVFLSSSSDNLEEERLCLKDFEERWNNNKHPDKPIKIIKWENLNKSRRGDESFQSGIDPYILNSHLIIFMFSHKLGKHTKEEYNLVISNKKFMRILLKEPAVESLHKKSRQWLDDFIELREFLNSIEEDKFIGEVPIRNISDFKLQLTDCIEEYVTYAQIDGASQLGNKSRSFDEKILSAVANTIAAIPPEVLAEMLKNKYEH